MGPKQDNVIRLVLVEDSVEDAEQLVSVLRNGGIAVRPTRTEDAEKLLQHLKAQPTDLVLANVKSKSFPFPQVGAAVIQSGKDVGLVALLSNVNEDSFLNAQAEHLTWDRRWDTASSKPLTR